MTFRFAVTMLAVAASMLAGCGGESTTTATSSMARAGASSAPSRTLTTNPATTTSREQKTVAEEPESELIGFTSPTGAIGCILNNRGVRCDVRDNTWTLPPRPADCELDYGQGVSMSVGDTASLVCAGDTTLSAGDPLPYGQSITAGSLNCQSAATGVTCRDASTGRGFTVAREAYTIF